MSRVTTAFITIMTHSRSDQEPHESKQLRNHQINSACGTRESSMVILSTKHIRQRELVSISTQGRLTVHAGSISLSKPPPHIHTVTRLRTWKLFSANAVFCSYTRNSMHHMKAGKRRIDLRCSSALWVKLLPL